LARETGRAQIVSSLEDTIGLPDALARLQEKRDRGRRTTPKEQERFVALVRERLDTFPVSDRLLFLRLTFLPAPFTAELAQNVCQVSLRLLTAMSKEALLITKPGSDTALTRYTMPQEIRDAAAHRICEAYRVPAAVLRQMQRRLGQLCERWIVQVENAPGENLAPLGRISEAEPFLALALDWTLAQPPTDERLNSLNLLRFRGAIALSALALPYLENVCNDPKYAAVLRVQAGRHAGYMWLYQNRFSNAIQCLDKARRVLEEAGPERVQDGWAWHAVIYEYLTLATHYAGNSRAALLHLERAIECFAHVQGGERMEIATYLRIRCEIQNSLGEYHEALRSADEALQLRSQYQLRRGITGGWPPVADALFWKALTLCRMNQSSGAADCLIKALDIWQRAGDKTGMGHCLRELAGLYAGEGRFAEARAHLEHAILLHEHTGSQGCRSAAVSTLADVLFHQGNWAEAQTRYAECLADAEKRECVPDIEFYRAKVSLCEPKEKPATYGASVLSPVSSKA